MSEEKPIDWDMIYTVEIDGKTLEAMKFLSRFTLDSDQPSLSAIGAADCLHCFQKNIRKNNKPKPRNEASGQLSVKPG